MDEQKFYNSNGEDDETDKREFLNDAGIKVNIKDNIYSNLPMQ
jgi:hypothetical protein